MTKYTEIKRNIKQQKPTTQVHTQNNFIGVYVHVRRLYTSKQIVLRMILYCIIVK